MGGGESEDQYIDLFVSGGELFNPEVCGGGQRDARVHQRRRHDGQDRGADVQHAWWRRPATPVWQDLHMGAKARRLKKANIETG